MRSAEPAGGDPTTTEKGASASVVMMRSVKPCEPSFSYHATVSSAKDAESASTAPSPSRSSAKTEMASSAEFVMIRSLKD